MEAKHTKGPWKIEPPHTSIRIAGPMSRVNIICEVTASAYAGEAPEYNQEDRANARLIASAPELLEAVEELYEAIDSSIELTPDLLQKVAGVIRKAKG